MTNLSYRMKNLWKSVSKAYKILWTKSTYGSSNGALIFNHKVTDSSPTIFMGNERITMSPSIKYLGILIENEENLKAHSQIIKKKTIARAKHFRSLTYKNQGISMKNSTKIFITICKPTGKNI